MTGRTLLDLCLLRSLVVLTALASGLTPAFGPSRVSAEEAVGFSQQVAPGIPVRSGHWATQQVTLTNPTSARVTLLSVTHASEAATRQYGRQIEVPPHARRTIQYPLKVPGSIPTARDRLELKTQLALCETGAQRVLPDATGRALRASVAIVEHETPTTALYANSDDGETRQLIDTCRKIQGRSTRIYLLGGQSLPASSAWLRAIDQLVIASDTLLSDPAGLIAVRQWVEEGGSAWILMDKVDEALLSALLGDAWDGFVLDRTSVATVSLRDARNVPAPRHGSEQSVASPIEQVLIHAGSAEVLYVAGRWPAACAVEIGRGRVLMTTLGPRGWLSRPASQSDSNGLTQSAGVDVAGLRKEPLGVLTERLFADRAVRLVPTSTLRESAHGMIGYRVPSRGLVATSLGALCMGIATAGVAFARRRRRERIVWFAPLAAGAAAILLAVIGYAHRVALPATIARAQVVEVHPATDDFTVRGALAIYEPTTALPKTTGTCGDVALDVAGGQGTTVPIVWSDLRDWELQNVALPAGMTTVEYDSAGNLDSSWARSLTLSGTGLEGVLRLPLEVIDENAVIMSAYGPPVGIQIQQDGRVIGRQDDELDRDSFTRGDVVTDRDRRRGQLLRDCYGQYRRELAAIPAIHLWTAPWEGGLAVAGPYADEGEALVIMPITLRRPTAGSRCHVPAPFIAFRVVDGPDGTKMSSAYSNATGEWVEDLSRQTQISLRFQLPQALLPLKLGQVTLFAEVHAPGRTAVVSGWRDGARVDVRRFESPAREELRVVVDDASLLQVDATGGLFLSVEIGAHAEEQDAAVTKTAWRIRDIYLTADAIVLEQK